MTQFPPISGKKFINALKQFGFNVIKTKGSHNFLQHQDGRCTVVPVHKNETIGSGLLSKIFCIHDKRTPGMDSYTGV